ncbi:hypothetical protein VNO77_35177 [Canavalia gladiata]|uniref:Uncharacterized protein n=1 Tax=Canavalia gladiata TaxID=3824 RepID=A0AAN9KIB0_CANGL
MSNPNWTSIHMWGWKVGEVNSAKDEFGPAVSNPNWTSIHIKYELERSSRGNLDNQTSLGRGKAVRSSIDGSISSYLLASHGVASALDYSISWPPLSQLQIWVYSHNPFENIEMGASVEACSDLCVMRSTFRYLCNSVISLMPIIILLKFAGLANHRQPLIAEMYIARNGLGSSTPIRESNSSIL